MDEFDVNTTSYDDSSDEHAPNGSSRRNFLKAAVVGSAAAVAAGGVGAATLTLTGHHTGLKRIVGLDALVSGITSDGCTTNTGGEDNNTLTHQTTFNNQESIYLWFKVNNVPAGSYTFDISPTIGGSSTIVEYQSTGNVRVYEYDPTSTAANFACNPAKLSDLPSASFTSNSLPISFTTTATKDLLLQVHLQGKNGNPGGDVTLTVTLTTGSTTEATKPVTFHINA